MIFHYLTHARAFLKPPPFFIDILLFIQKAAIKLNGNKQVNIFIIIIINYYHHIINTIVYKLYIKNT